MTTARTPPANHTERMEFMRLLLFTAGCNGLVNRMEYRHIERSLNAYVGDLVRDKPARLDSPFIRVSLTGSQCAWENYASADECQVGEPFDFSVSWEDAALPCQAALRTFSFGSEAVPVRPSGHTRSDTRGPFENGLKNIEDHRAAESALKRKIWRLRGELDHFDTLPDEHIADFDRHIDEMTSLRVRLERTQAALDRLQSHGTIVLNLVRQDVA